jgi:hypothetical protein
MKIQEGFKRRVRIEGKLDDLKGYRLKIYDVETGEEITNVVKALIILDAREYNAVELTYAETDEQGKYIMQDGDIVRKTVRVHFPDIAITAFEVENDR